MLERKNERWLVKASHEETEKSAQVKEIVEKIGLRAVTAQLLVNRGCTTAELAHEFLEQSTERLHDPFLMKDMRRAAERIIEKAESGCRIVIYGDYDVDGVTSVSILYMYLSDMGADVRYYIPSRLGEGYGMSEMSLRHLREDGCDTVVTVDTGITAFNEAIIAKELGIELIITDHHECHSEVPVAHAVVNPKQADCGYPFKELAGVGVVFKLLCAMELLRFPDDGTYECIKRVSEKYIDLVAIGTVADVMPLRDENRLIVSKGLSSIEKCPRPSLEALVFAASGDGRVQKKKITSGYIGFTVAPRVNAAGRIRSASTAVELFLSTDEEKAMGLALELCEINKERQLEENKIIEEAFQKIDAEHDFEHDPVIVLADEDWHHGIIGIVASRITEKYSCPCILISFDGVGDGSGSFSGKGDDIGKGSGRSIKGLNLVDALACCGDLLVKFGGHELAAGLSIRRDKLDAFRQRINDYARGCFDGAQPVSAIEAECELVPSETDMGLAAELYKLEPYGVSNPVPLFYMHSMKIDHISSVGGGKHTKLMISRDELIITAMYFRRSPQELDIFEGDVIDVIFNLDINEYQNIKNLQFIIKDLRLSARQREFEECECRLYEEVNSQKADFAAFSEKEIDSIIPQRSDFGAVYNLLKKELRNDHDTFSVRALCRLLHSAGFSMRYVKVKYIIRVFQELNILGVDEIDQRRDMYRFKYIYVKSKADLTKSNILRRLKASFIQKQV